LRCRRNPTPWITEKEGLYSNIEGAPDTRNTESLIAIQILDGVANVIFGVVSILVVADRTRATGRFNLVQGSLATAVGLGAALSTTFGGRLIQHFSCRISFLSLGAIAALAFLLLWTAIPETLPERNELGSDRRKPFRDCAWHKEALDARLYQSGARFLAGNSATNFGIVPGRGLHLDLALLHRIGLSPRLAMTRLGVEAGINALQSSFIYRRKSLNGH
jgi:MFS family permease